MFGVLDKRIAMATTESLERFVTAQENTYSTALCEIQAGRKQSHWMWFIFPQVRGLGMSGMSRKYGIENLQEAAAYLAHPVLGKRLIEITGAVLSNRGNDAHAIFGSPDDMKLRSCCTLFSMVPGAPPIFDQLIDRFFNGKKDERTLSILGRERN